MKIIMCSVAMTFLAILTRDGRYASEFRMRPWHEFHNAFLISKRFQRSNDGVYWFASPDTHDKPECREWPPVCWDWMDLSRVARQGHALDDGQTAQNLRVSKNVLTKSVIAWIIDD